MFKRSYKFEKDIIGWDVSSWIPSLNFFDKNIDYNNISKVLELGAFNKSGGYALHFAKKKLDVTCTGITYPDHKLISIHKKYTCHKYIKYDKVDATDISLKENFDIICFKSMLGGIARFHGLDKIKTVFSEIYKSLNQGGYLVFSENLFSNEIYSNLRSRYRPDNWYYLNLDEIKSCIDYNQFKFIDYKTSGFISCIGRNELQRSILSQFDKLFFNHILPSNYHYIVFAVLKKV